MKERKFIGKYLYIKRPEPTLYRDSGLTYLYIIVSANDVQENMLTND